MRTGTERWQGALIVAALHAAAIAALLSYQPARDAMASAMPIMVSLITPQVSEPPKPRPVAKPAPAVRPAPPAPIVAAPPIETPAPAIATPSPPVAEPPRIQASTPVVAEPPAAIAAAAPRPVTPPRFDAAYLENPAPAYPSLARRLREQGKVVLRVLVSAAGAPERVELRASSGSPRLDGAALETVRRWRFVPARQGTDAVSAWVLVPLSFSLEG